jgi:DNA repair exonuclease SbcCD ATPase subunit
MSVNVDFLLHFDEVYSQIQSKVDQLNNLLDNLSFDIKEVESLYKNLKFYFNKNDVNNYSYEDFISFLDQLTSSINDLNKDFISFTSTFTSSIEKDV